MISEAEALQRQMGRLDSPRRIAWLRDQMRGYVIDLAARHFFSLPTWCAGEQVEPITEATAAVTMLGLKAGLTPDELRAALKAEWNAGIALAEKVGDKLRVVALSHLKLTGNRDGIPGVLRQARDRFPADWPFLAEHDLAAIASTFQRPAMRRRRAA